MSNNQIIRFLILVEIEMCKEGYGEESLKLSRDIMDYFEMNRDELEWHFEGLKYEFPNLLEEVLCDD